MGNKNRDDDYFRNHGFVILRNVISDEKINLVLSEGSKVSEDSEAKRKQPKTFGATHYWKIMDMYSTLHDELFSLMTSEFMANIVTRFLGDTAYLFNEQFVFKKPHEEFLFPWHNDNSCGPSYDKALDGDYKAITCCWFLTDNNPKNGGLEFQSKTITTPEDLKEAKPIVPKDTIPVVAYRGDMGVWDGNTLHRSGPNTTDENRYVWLQVYTTKPLGENFKSGYYFRKFIEKGKKVI